MAQMQSRRSAALTPAVVLFAIACALLAVVRTPRESQAFVGAPGLRAPELRGGVALRGFKEDFEEWRSSLTDDEKALVTEQAEGEFNKAFRKSDTYSKDLPEDKIKSFSSILGKFFDNEAEDYKKELELKTPDYDALLKKAGDKKMDFSLSSRIVEVDRDADRRYNFALQKIAAAERKGEYFPQSSPLIEKWSIQNNDTESHGNAVKVIEFIKQASEHPSATPENKAVMKAAVEKGVPAMGEAFELPLPMQLVNQLHTFMVIWRNSVAKQSVNWTEAEMKNFLEKEQPETHVEVINYLLKNYVAARDEVEADAQKMKAFFKSQAKYKDDTSRTKADVLKEIWAELPKHTDKPVPPLDEELLAELAEMPAVVEGEFMHSWGTADKLYKSEAIDAFGAKYLLGVFETPEEAQKAFDDWNAEYEKARVNMKDELEQWGKQEQARLEADPEPVNRIKKVLEQARR